MRERLLLLNFRKSRLIFFFLTCFHLASSQTNVRVANNEGEALIGALVSIPAKEIHLSTSIDGMVAIPDNIPHNERILISYLSYESLETDLASIQKNQNVVRLSSTTENLKEVLILGRNQKYKSDVLLPVAIIDQDEIAMLQAQTPADLLEKEGSVFVQKSQMGGGSPVIRGFEANKILLVVDGVRLNNAIFRSGHLQSSITLDEQALESLEVLFGPGSIVYGSEALGGVVHYRTQTPKLSDQFNHSINFMSRLVSSNNERSLNVNYSFGTQKFAGLITATASDFGNLRAGGNYPDAYPDFGKRFDYAVASDDPGNNLSNEVRMNEDPNVQVGTNYSQQDYMAKFKYQLNDRISFILNNQYSTSSNIPRYDLLTERDNDTLAFAEWYYGPQNRGLISLSAQLNLETTLFDDIHVIAAYQKINEDRISRSLGSSTREENFEHLSVYSITADFNKSIGPKLDISYGIDVQDNDLTSTSSGNIFTRYPNGENNMRLFGIYTKAAYPLSLHWSLDAGVRYSQSKITLGYIRDSFFEWPEYFYEGLSNTSSNVSYLSSLQYAKDKFQIGVLGGTAFRSPNIDDLAKIRVKTDEITVPNPDLKPETTLNAEMQLRYGTKTSYVDVSLFTILLQDAIIRDNFMLADGSSTYIVGGDTLSVVANVNAEKARVYGFSTSFKKTFSPDFELNGSITWTKGESEDAFGNSSPLGHIPPLYGNISSSYKHQHFRHQLSFRFNGRKKLEDFGGSVDNPEFATPEGSLAWQTFNYYLYFDKLKYFDIQLGIENIFDKHYRPFSSGLSASGRNFILTLRTKL